ncbi:hypothetical protein SAMN04487895_101223 [Paenibacillus sophorae]|uniref:Phenazine biosynthesis protein phzB 1 n=3 Tax=Paenibacillus TaxID=44249 RepID=X4ZLR9_9BACL|nr:phenazine biosynthesis protein phzB 1 [Paenibacillus sabinae T27]SEN34462.1 hypothetical protein SAMN04487895_101223 [Paenibacillus sophorae]
MANQAVNYEARLREAQEIFEKFKNSMIEKDMDKFIELFDENVIFEFPFAPKGYTLKLEGKSALYKYVKEIPNKIELSKFKEPTFHLTLNPNVIIIEFGIEEGQAIITGKPYLQSYISVIETKENKIVHYKDYWNPVVALAALGEESSFLEVYKAQQQ